MTAAWHKRARIETHANAIELLVAYGRPHCNASIRAQVHGRLQISDLIFLILYLWVSLAGFVSLALDFWF